MRKTYIFLQARTSSTRLPQKVLKPLLNKEMILHQLQRVSRSKMVDKVILLTSNLKEDDKLANIVSQEGFDIYRGSHEDVLGRFYECAIDMNLDDDDTIVRVTGDCPVHDHRVIDELINAFYESNAEYISNCREPFVIYPDGLDAEVFSVATLKKSALNAKKTSQREHVTPYMYNSGLFKALHLKKEPLYSNWRLTVDEERDFKLIENIYNHFGNNSFSFEDIIEYLTNNPHLLSINQNIIRNEGYLKSLKEDDE